MSVLSASSTWSIWTGSAVCVIGIVAPEESVGADGLPGCSSTNQLPSRKIRGRSFIVASEWIGRPLDSISIVTSAGVALALDRGDLAHVHARDAHRRFRVDVQRGGELGVQTEAVFERDVLGEAEVDDEHSDDHEHDDPDAHRV